MDGASESGRYAVVFAVGQGVPAAGALVVDRDRLLLEGRSSAERVELSISFTELVEVRIGRSQERLDGRPTLLLGRAGRPVVRIEPLGLCFLHELSDLLTALASPCAEELVAVVVPLRKGRLERVLELVGEGPPFDPAELGLRQHEVFLTAEEATFVFAGPGARASLERASREPSLWRVGLAWRDCIGGRPRVASVETAPLSRGEQPIYSWAASDEGS